MKIVCDTNTIVSGFLFRGNESRLFELADEGKMQNFISEEIIEEVARVLAYPKLKTTREEREKITGKLIGISTMVEPKRQIKAVQEDPTDNKFIECAIEAKADYIVSGDKHLLKLKEFEGIKIARTKEVLEMAEKLARNTGLKQVPDKIR